MALFQILHGDDSRLDTKPFKEGNCYLTHSGFFYADINLGTVESPNNQRIKIKADAETAQKLIELNKALNVSIWVGTKEEYDAITDKDDACLYITTDETEEVQWEYLSNKVTELNDSVTDEQYPSALAVWNILSNLNQYEKTENKLTELLIENEPTDIQYYSAKCLHGFFVDLKTALADLSNDIADRQKTSEKVTAVTATSTDAQYPSAKAVYDYVTNLGVAIDTYITKYVEKVSRKTSTLNSSSTDTQYPSAKAVYEFVTDSIASDVPIIHASTSEPTASDGKIGDLWVVIE